MQNAFFDVIDVTGLLFAIFYILTALATIVYYRRRVFGSAWDFLILGLLPLGAAVFLGWMFVKSLPSAPSTAALVADRHRRARHRADDLARFVLRSPFFQIARESDASGSAGTALACGCRV